MRVGGLTNAVLLWVAIAACATGAEDDGGNGYDFGPGGGPDGGGSTSSSSGDGTGGDGTSGGTSDSGGVHTSGVTSDGTTPGGTDGTDPSTSGTSSSGTGTTSSDPTTGGQTTGDQTTSDPTTGGETTSDPTTGGQTTSDPTTGGGTGGGGCPLFEYTFDPGPEGWTASGTNSDWAHGVPSSGPGADHTGGGSLWATNLGGNADTCQCSQLFSPAVDLSAHAGKTINLQLWHWYDFRESSGGGLCGDDSYSGGIVEVNSGGGWTKLTPGDGYDGNTLNCSGGNGSCDPCSLDEITGAFTGYGTESTWVRETFDLSAHTTASVQVRLYFGSHDGYGCYPNSLGWYVDDVLISTEEEC